jgi:hypothetical protein
LLVEVDDTNNLVQFRSTGTVSGGYTFLTGNTERMRITSDGYLRMASGSNGIQFNGDTAAANALNDYEEGTWTPTITGLTLGNATGQSFLYTKVGSLVTVSIRFTWGSTTSSSGEWEFSLPFGAAQGAGGAAYLLDSGSASYCVAAVVANISFGGIKISDGTGAGFVSNTAPFTWAVNDRFTCSLTYRTA